MDTDSAGNKTFYTREPDGQLVSESTGGATYYYVFDGLGSTVALTDSGQNTAVSYTYDPFGFTNTTGTLANRFKYAGGYLAATGLYHFGQRWYDPRTDRWTQEDPLNNPLNLQQADRYSYVANDPIDSVDPSGMGLFSSITHGLIGFGAGVGAVAVATVGSFATASCIAATEALGTIHCLIGIGVPTLIGTTAGLAFASSEFRRAVQGG